METVGWIVMALDIDWGLPRVLLYALPIAGRSFPQGHYAMIVCQKLRQKVIRI